MITGALLLDKEETVSELFSKRVVRIAAVIVLFTGVHYVVDVLRGQIANASPADFLGGLAQNTLVEQYWYLYAYLGLLILLPVLREWVKGMRPQTFTYLFVLEAVLGVLVPLGYDAAGWTFPSLLWIVPVYFYYLLMGYALEKGKLRFLQNGNSRCLVTGGIVACVTAAAFLCIGLGTLRGYEREDLEYLTPILSILCFEGVRRFCERHPFRERTNQWIAFLGSCSFGIYLTEHLVRILLLPLYLYLTEHSVGVIACTVYVAGTYVIGLFLTWILKKLPLIGKLL